MIVTGGYSTRDGPSAPQAGPAPAQVAFAPAGQILAVIGSRDFVWDLATDRQQSLPPSSRPGSSRAVAFSPDGRRLVLADADGQIRFLDVARLLPPNP